MMEHAGKTPMKDVEDIPKTRCITEWIGVFQWEEYGERRADVREGWAMAHFNIFLARQGGLPSKVSKRSHMVNAPISELTVEHLRHFLAWIAAQPSCEGVGKEWYSPTLAKFIEWLKDNKAITDGKRRELLSGLQTAGTVQ